MFHVATENLRKLIRSQAHALEGGATQYDKLLEQIGSARFVLLGEASHGTHEFYKQRAEIAKIRETFNGLDNVAILRPPPR